MTLISLNPATGEPLWEGAEASQTEVSEAVERAGAAFTSWRDTPIEEKQRIVGAFAELLTTASLEETISRETGKPLWESKDEVNAMIGKAEISIEAQQQRAGSWSKGNVSVEHRPHGLLAILGPFNFPGHLPNGHIIPALLAGNTLVFKPSEFTPLVGERLADLWQEAGLPPGVLNLVQGGHSTGQALTSHESIAGILFTGSHRTGQILHRLHGPHPERILALEMGGNTPLVVTNISDLQAAAQTIILSAYVTSGQRCTCARRLILTPEAEHLLEPLTEMIGKIAIGPYTDTPEPFMGPLIHDHAATTLLDAYKDLIVRGAKSLIPLSRSHSRSFLSPGLIDSTSIVAKPDEELFGPLLQITRVKNLSQAIAEANNTRYGLAAALLSDDPSEWATFKQEVRAGVVNWNCRTTGASSAAPFGGVGISGNHRPSAYYAADYSAYPVASIEQPSITFNPHVGIAS